MTTNSNQNNFAFSIQRHSCLFDYFYFSIAKKKQQQNNEFADEEEKVHLHLVYLILGSFELVAIENGKNHAMSLMKKTFFGFIYLLLPFNVGRIGTGIVDFFFRLKIRGSNGDIEKIRNGIFIIEGVSKTLEKPFFNSSNYNGLIQN